MAQLIKKAEKKPGNKILVFLLMAYLAGFVRRQEWLGIFRLAG